MSMFTRGVPGQRTLHTEMHEINMWSKYKGAKGSHNLMQFVASFEIALDRKKRRVYDSIVTIDFVIESSCRVGKKTKSFEFE